MPIDWIKEYIRNFRRDRRHDDVITRAIDLAQAEKYGEAAEIYSSFAVESRAESDLMASSYHQMSFKMWVKAKEAGKALEEARSSLRMLSTDDGKWLKYNAGEKADGVIQMVSQLYAAGYTDEGQALSAEANTQFETFGLHVRCAAAPVRRSEFPSLCTQCGGSLPPGLFDLSITCPFCQTVIYSN